jgi:hypothetical protein
MELFLWVFRSFLVFGIEAMRPHPRTWLAVLLCGLGGAYASLEGGAAFDRENRVLAADRPSGDVADAEGAVAWAHVAYFTVMAAELGAGGCVTRRAAWFAAALGATAAATAFAEWPWRRGRAFAFTVAPAVVFGAGHLLLTAMALAWFRAADSQAYVDLRETRETGSAIDVGALSSSTDE